MSKELQGASYLLKGLTFLFKLRILPFVLIPILLNTVIYYLLIDTGYKHFDLWLNSWLGALPEWLNFIESILRFLFFALVAVAAALTFSSVSNLIGSPFYGLLAEQVTVLATDEAPEQPLNVATLLRMIPRTIGRELRKLLYYLPRLLLLGIGSLLTLIPLLAPLQPVITILWFIFGARMLSMQYLDYAFDNDEKSFGTMRQSLKKHRRLSLSFGAITQLALIIPLLPIIFVPAAVCGGTLLYCEKLSDSSV